MKNSKRDLSHCAAKMKARGVEARAIRRRSAIAKNLREKRDLSPSEYRLMPISFVSLTTLQTLLISEQETRLLS